MRNIWKLLAIVMCLLSFASIGTANAQLQINLGNDEQVFRLLRSAGYSNPVVTKRSLTIIRTEACKDGKKYQLKVSILGRITSRSEIGNCRTRQQVAAFSEKQAQRLLAQNRYTNIETRGARGGIQAFACRNGRKFEVFFNRRGKVVTRNDLGYCAPKRLSKEQVRNSLRTAGYRRINVLEARPPRYLAEACKDSRRYRLRMNERAEVENRRAIGDCRRPFSTDAITGLLQERGYDRIKLVRTNRAPYLAEGCKGDALQEVQVNRSGEILREYRIGKCARPLTRDALASKISNAGHVIVSLDKNGNGWRSQECRQERKMQVNYDPFGQQTNIRTDGNCRSETVLNVLRTLESRGAKSVQAFVEGCFDGSKYRWSFDRLGNRTDRARVGTC